MLSDFFRQVLEKCFDILIYITQKSIFSPSSDLMKYLKFSKGEKILLQELKMSKAIHITSFNKSLNIHLGEGPCYMLYENTDSASTLRKVVLLGGKAIKQIVI